MQTESADAKSADEESASAPFEFPTKSKLPPTSREIFAVAFHPKNDALLAYASNDGDAHIYDLTPTGENPECAATCLHVVKHSNRSTKVRLHERVTSAALLVQPLICCIPDLPSVFGLLSRRNVAGCWRRDHSPRRWLHGEDQLVQHHARVRRVRRDAAPRSQTVQQACCVGDVGFITKRSPARTVLTTAVSHRAQYL